MNAGDFGFTNIVGRGTLSVSGDTTLSNVTASGTLGVTGQSTLGHTSVSGTLDVSGNTTLKTTSVTGTLTTPAGFSVDTSSNVVSKGTITLGTNSVVRSDGSGNFVVNGNVLAAGSVVSNYNSTYPPIDPAADWEGVWTQNSQNSSSLRGYVAFVKESNNTYTAYSNALASQPTNALFYNTSFQVLRRNIVPVFTKDLTGKVTANSITINTSVGSGSTTTISRRLTTADIGSNFAFSPSNSLNAQIFGYSFYQRIMRPTDVTPAVGADWFSAYQSEYNEERITKMIPITLLIHIMLVHSHLLQILFILRTVHTIVFIILMLGLLAI